MCILDRHLFIFRRRRYADACSCVSNSINSRGAVESTMMYIEHFSYLSPSARNKLSFCILYVNSKQKHSEAYRMC